MKPVKVCGVVVDKSYANPNLKRSYVVCDTSFFASISSVMTLDSNIKLIRLV